MMMLKTISGVQKSKRGGPFKSKFGGNHHLIDPVYGDTNSYEGGQQQTSSGKGYKNCRY